MLERIADGRTDLVFEFIAAGGAPTAKAPDGASLIQHCAYYGDVSAIRFLITHGESLQSLGDDMGLNAAAFHGHWRLCQFLLEQGSDANSSDANTGETPLHSALSSARDAQRWVVTVLLDHGADPNRTTKPMMETGAFMRDVRTCGETPLHRAASFADEETIQLLLDAGAKIDAKDMNGDTPLSWASWHLRPDSILRKLCYGSYSIRAGRLSMDACLLGSPHQHAH
ncbi:MAG: ankyrin repeat domain-containing protein [Terracidiphilus sp.]